MKNDTFIEFIINDPKWEIKEDGKIFRLGRLATFQRTNNYLGITYNGKRLLVHRVVYRKFAGPLNSLQINHINGIKNDNRIENLQAVSNKDNVNHAFKVLGRKPTYGSAKLTNYEIVEIRKLYNTGKFTQIHLSKKYKVSQSTISALVRKETWSKL